MYLVVDPSLTIRRIVTRILVGLGIHLEHVVHAPTMADALRALDGANPMLIVTEWDIPGGTGLELAQHVRQRPDAAAIPILLITSRSLSEEIERASASGISDVVLRPFTPHLMRERLGELLGQPVL